LDIGVADSGQIIGMRSSDPSDHRKLTRRISTLAFAILGAFAMGGVFEGLIQANV
jgi:hypothetical protein